MKYRAKHFQIEELVHPEFIERFGRDFSWQFLRPEGLLALDFLRERFGPITVNNYLWGGPRKFSGLRPPSGGVGGKHSMHRYGCAFDCVFHKTTPQEVYEWILANQREIPWITRMENAHETQTWLHFDCANTQSDVIVVFNP